MTTYAIELDENPTMPLATSSNEVRRRSFANAIMFEVPCDGRRSQCGVHRAADVAVTRSSFRLSIRAITREGEDRRKPSNRGWADARAFGRQRRSQTIATEREFSTRAYIAPYAEGLP